MTVPMGGVAPGIAADSVLIGGASAEAVANGSEDAGTGGWKPGDTATAVKRAGELGLAALLLPGHGGTGEAPDVAGDMEDGYLNVVAGTLAGWDEGTPDDELSGMLDDAVGDEDYAQGLSLNQILMISGQAALAWYLGNGVTMMTWRTEDPGACPVCLANEAASPITAGTSFPSGHTSPPAHPRCRCFGGPAFAPPLSGS